MRRAIGIAVVALATMLATPASAQVTDGTYSVDGKASDDTAYRGTATFVTKGQITHVVRKTNRGVEYGVALRRGKWMFVAFGKTAGLAVYKANSQRRVLRHVQDHWYESGRQEALQGSAAHHF